MNKYEKQLKSEGWRECVQGAPLPSEVNTVVLMCDVVDGASQPTGALHTLVVRKPKWGWSPIIGWEFWYPLPSGVFQGSEALT